MAQAVIRRRLTAEVILGRSKGCGQPSGTTTNIFPRVLWFPLSVSLHQCPYSLHLDTTLYQEKHVILKNVSNCFLLCCLYIPEAQWLLYVSSRFTLKNPTFGQQNTVLRFV